MEPTPRQETRHDRRPLFASSLTYAGAALALTFGIAACVPAPDSTPAPTPTRVTQAPAPAPAPAPVPTYDNWMDAPATPGNWSYSSQTGGTIAAFGASANEPLLTMRCDRSAGRIVLTRMGQPSRQSTGQPGLVIRSETATRALPAQTATGQSAMLSAAVVARDPLLDAMALTKGRFAVETPGYPTLYLPAWAEVTRVIEDCR